MFLKLLLISSTSSFYSHFAHSIYVSQCPYNPSYLDADLAFFNFRSFSLFIYYKLACDCSRSFYSCMVCNIKLHFWISYRRLYSWFVFSFLLRGVCISISTPSLFLKCDAGFYIIINRKPFDPFFPEFPTSSLQE